LDTVDCDLVTGAGPVINMASDYSCRLYYINPAKNYKYADLQTGLSVALAGLSRELQFTLIPG